METEKTTSLIKKRRRNPLCDLTNTNTLTPIKHRQSSTKPKSTKPKIPKTEINNSNNTTAVLAASSTSTDKNEKRSAVFVRRHSVSKERKGKKAIMEPQSCFTDVKNPISRFKLNDEGITGLSSKSCTVPHKKKKRLILPQKDVAKPDDLPQDFIEKQRAYFAEIDAFQLSEEEVDLVD